jgi:ketosteroid isomerase-like protein
MPTDTDALAIGRRFIAAIEARDFDGAIALLADDVRQVFPLSVDGSEAHGPIFTPKDEAAYYVRSLAGKFASLKWTNPDWTGSINGDRAFMEARGDAIVAHSGAPYHNTYITRFDVRGGLITEIREYANMGAYAKLGIEPAEQDMKAVERGLAATPQ